VAFVLFCAGFFFLVYNGEIGYMPPVEELKNPQDKFASVIYTSDGKEMGRYFRNTGNRVYADFDEISPAVVDALIATEDARFNDHSGIDIKAVFRAIVKTLAMGQKNAGGGSTITQQLAKQLYTPPSNGLLSRAVQKPIEWMIAIKLERFYSKEEILKMYLNQFDFLYNAVGIKSAAKVYFDKSAADLDVLEAATLVGMVKNPSYFNPVRQPERTRQRRNVVLEQMYKADMLSKEELQRLKEQPLTLNFQRVDHKDGLAPYFREELRRMLSAKKPVRDNYPSWDKQRFVDDSIAWATNPLFGWIEKTRKPDGTKYDIYNDGLKIYTTIDSRMQQYAEEAVHEHMQSLQTQFFREKRGQSTAPYTTNRNELSDNMRQKLILNAMKQSERGRIARLRGLSDEELQAEFNQPFEMTVFSYDGPVDTVMTPRDSMLYSKSFLRTGFMSMDPSTGFVKAYVGGPDFRFFQYDMVSTGRRQVGSTIKPFLYTYAFETDFTPCTEMLNEQPTLYDENGRIWQPRNTGKARVGEMVDLRWALTNSNNWISARIMDRLSPAELVKRMHSYGITNQLPAVKSLCLGPSEVSVKEMVTAYSAFADKGMRADPIYVTAIADANGNIITDFQPNLTGTTNDSADGWFMAFTTDLVSGTWVGGEDRYIHFNNMAQGQGASMALPIYGKFISKVYADPTLPYSQKTVFDFPANLNLCENTIGYEETEETVEEAMSGAFD